MGQTQNHTVQCVLILNIFTEKIFMVLWLWYVFLAAITLGNLTSWLYTFLDSPTQEHFIFNNLEMSGQRVFANDSDKGLKDIQIQVDRFINKYLKSDGILILRLISQHADIVFTTELIYKLWESHYAIELQRQTLKNTEAKWNEHMQRLKAIQERAVGENIYFTGEDDQVETNVDNPIQPIKTENITDNIKEKTHIIKKRFVPAKKIRRTFSAESLQNEKHHHFSSEEEDDSSDEEFHDSRRPSEK